MHLARRHSAGTQLVTLIGVLLLGPGIGTAMAALVAPESGVVGMVSALVFPVVLFGGLVLWLGAAVLSLVLELLLCLVRREWPGGAAADEMLVPPGHRAFIGLGAALGAVAGLVAWAGSIGWSLPLAVAVYAVAGAGYGLLLDRLGHAGLLPFPEPA